MLRALAIVAGIALCGAVAWAHDDGRFAGSPLKAWFDGLRSGKGLCCSFADGRAVEDVDWDATTDAQFPYRVRVDGKWLKVPSEAVVTEPNKFGRAVVWPVDGADGEWVRCFIPGAGA